MKLFCPVCRLELGPGLPVVERWVVLLAHIEDRHAFYAEMLTIAYYQLAPRAEPVQAHTLERTGAALTDPRFYPEGDRW